MENMILTTCACNVGVLSEVDLLLPRYRTQIQMIRQYHRMICMDDSRLTKQIFLWDKEINERSLVSTWSKEVKIIFSGCNFDDLFTSNSSFDIKNVVSDIKNQFKYFQNNYLSTECASKPKLRTFIKFKDFNETPVYILKTLTFHQHRMMAKTRLGCLPIRLETARYSIPRLPESERNCLVCKNSSFYPTNNPNLYHIESEIHYLFICNAYNVDRNEWLRKMNLPPDFDSLTIECKLKIVLNDPNNVKLTSQFITTAYNIRSKILN